MKEEINIKTVVAYGCKKLKVENAEKLYKTSFNKADDKMIVFECYFDHPVKYKDTIDCFINICQNNEIVSSQRLKVEVSPGYSYIYIWYPIVNKMGISCIDSGACTAKIKISNSDVYSFDFWVMGRGSGDFLINGLHTLSDALYDLSKKL